MAIRGPSCISTLSRLWFPAFYTSGAARVFTCLFFRQQSTGIRDDVLPADQLADNSRPDTSGKDGCSDSISGILSQSLEEWNNRTSSKLQSPIDDYNLQRDEFLFGGLESKHGSTPKGVYKAIILGEVGNAPVQKVLRNGSSVTMFSVGTGGMRNNRRPFDGETPIEYARRSAIQWHRVAVYQERIGALAMRSLRQGSHVYLEGNMETRVFLDNDAGHTKHLHEIAIRQGGCILSVDQSANSSSVNETVQANRRTETTM